MRKFLKFLTMFLFVIAGSALLIGIAGSAVSGAGSPGPVISSTSLSNAKSGITLLDQDKNGLTVRMDIGKVEFIRVTTRKGTFILPRIPNFTRSFKVGEPCLPIASELISIPFGCKLKAKVIDSKTKEVTLPGVLMPVQPPLSKSVDPDSVPFKINKEIYKRPGKYALPLVTTKVLGTLRATRLGNIAISPVEYYPTKNRATVYKSVTVRIAFKNPNWNLTKKMQKRYASFYFEPIFRQVLNHKKSNYLRDDLTKYPVKYVIVADRMFESQLQPFIQWKTKKGFVVITGYTDTIGSSTSAIKTYLQNLYNTENPAPSFVLFVGDDQQIPAWSGSAGGHITDLKYCEFTGDDLPEIYYGRFSAQNTAQLQPQIDKTMEYEQYTMPDPSYLGEVTLVSGVDSGYADPYGNGQINYGTNLYFNASHGIYPNVWLYPASDGSGVPAAVRQTVNDGIGFYNYTAHCGHTGPSDPSFTTSDISNLTNAHKYLLGIGNCCLSNTFGDNYSTPCFGEAWLQAEDKGGIGWIGGSNSTYWDEDYWWGVGNGPIDGSGPTYQETGIGAYDGVFHDHGEPVNLHYTTNAAIIFAGNMAVTEAGSSMTDYYWEIYHLMGDPAVMTYMGVPAVNNVFHPSSVSPTDTSITVQANPGSYVGISKDGVLHGAGYIDSSGSAVISITPFGSTGTADIVVTCQNKVPYISTIDISGTPTPPVADFVGSPTSGDVPLTVNFTDQSTGATSWSWDFGDGGSSTDRNPTYQYTNVGTYTVTLTATNAYGSDVETKVNYIQVNTFTPSDALALSDIPVLGTIAGDYTYTHDSDGVYEVITEVNSGTHPRKWYSILEHKWDFDVKAANAITFYVKAYRPDNSDGDNFSFEYSTDDATYNPLVTVSSSTEQTYSASIPNTVSGTVYIRVVDTDHNNSMQSLDNIFIDYMYIASRADAPPVANFTGSPTSGEAPLTVSFTDQSTNNPTSWSWTFGDGGSSADQNPTYIYNSPGIYTVSLTATNAAGSDTETKTGYITATGGPGDTMFVYNIEVGRIKQGSKWRGTCTVIIYDNNAQPVSGAVVYVTATGPTGGTYSGTTLADGSVDFQTAGIKNPVGEWCFEVTNVTHATLTYDPASNVVTKVCESGPVF